MLQGRFDSDRAGDYDPLDPLSNVYISISPFTLWELDFKTSLRSVDVSGVTALKLSFSGNVKALMDRTALDSGWRCSLALPQPVTTDGNQISGSSKPFGSFE
jgi:hypothetical protein